jgi:glycosyltransferase involved in cell wall biosynthesis
MRVLFLTQYYPPEIGAAQQRLASWACALRRAGNVVTVLTALPNYPTGKIFEHYRGRAMMEEEVAGIRVIRAWVYATKSKRFVPRVLSYVSFTVTASVLGMCRAGAQDWVVVEMPPLFLGIAGLLLSKLKRAKLILNVSDLWPESAVALGVLRNRLVIRLAELLERFLYRRATLITGQTQGIVDGIRARCPEGVPVWLIPNGADVEAFLTTSQGDPSSGIRKEFGLEGKFVVGYAGLHGLAQGLETLIQSARILADHKDVVFAFFGDGPEKERLIRLSDELHLTNVRFYPPQPSARMPEVYSLLDVAVVALKAHPLFEGALPSKMFEAMAAGVPIVVAIKGEAEALTEQAEAGICVEPENPQAMAQAILRLYANPILRRRMGANGQRYVKQYCDRTEIARKFEQLLSQFDDVRGRVDVRGDRVARGAKNAER